MTMHGFDNWKIRASSSECHREAQLELKSPTVMDQLVSHAKKSHAKKSGPPMFQQKRGPGLPKT